jgi:hypothetical protein
MSKMDEQEQRIDTIISEGVSMFEEALVIFFNHLKQSLQFSCVVTGIEDFDWEEYYVLGHGSQAEYKKLKKTQPSYQDKYDLLAIEQEVMSKWMMFSEDIGAQVKRKSDGQEFWLGLAELKAVDKKSKNHQLLDDYSVWFVNNR